MGDNTESTDPIQTPDSPTKGKRLHDGEPRGLTPPSVRGPRTEEDIIIDKLINALTNNRVLDRLRYAITKPLQEEIIKRDKKIDTLEKETTALRFKVSKLEEREDEREQYSRRNSLPFWTDITEEKEENTDAIAVSCAEKLGVKLNQRTYVEVIELEKKWLINTGQFWLNLYDTGRVKRF